MIFDIFGKLKTVRLYFTYIKQWNRSQGSTIGIRRVRMCTYFYCRTHDFGHVYVITYAHFFLWFFKVFKIFLVLLYWSWLFKKLMLDILPLIYLFVLGRDGFLYVYICFRETLSFNFTHKLSNKYFFLHRSTCQFRVSLIK